MKYVNSLQGHWYICQRRSALSLLWDNSPPPNKLLLTHLSHPNILHPTTYFIVTDITKTVTGAWSRVLLEKLIVTQLVKKFSALCATRGYIIVCTGSRHWSLS
jgi:hypothetical protein